MPDLTANQAVSELSEALSTGRFDPDAWTATAPTPTAHGNIATDYAGRVGACDVVLRRIRTPTGARHGSEYFFRVTVMRDGKALDHIRGDDDSTPLALVVNAVEKLCILGPAIANNQKFTRHVVGFLEERLGRGELGASDWDVEGPNPSGTATNFGISYTTRVGQTEIALARNSAGPSLFSITVRREDVVIGMACADDTDGALAKAVGRVAEIHATRVTELQVQSRQDLDGV